MQPGRRPSSSLPGTGTLARNSSRSWWPAIISADRIAESSADVRLDGDEVATDPDDGHAGHAATAYMRLLRWRRIPPGADRHVPSLVRDPEARAVGSSSSDPRATSRTSKVRSPTYTWRMPLGPSSKLSFTASACARYWMLRSTPELPPNDPPAATWELRQPGIPDDRCSTDFEIKPSAQATVEIALRPGEGCNATAVVLTQPRLPRS